MQDRRRRSTLDPQTSAAIGQKNLEVTIDRIQRSLEKDEKTSWKDLRRPTGGLFPAPWA